MQCRKMVTLQYASRDLNSAGGVVLKAVAQHHEAAVCIKEFQKIIDLNYKLTSASVRLSAPVTVRLSFFFLFPLPPPRNL